jgi:hypothetical protein
LGIDAWYDAIICVYAQLLCPTKFHNQLLNVVNTCAALSAILHPNGYYRPLVQYVSYEIFYDYAIRNSLHSISTLVKFQLMANSTINCADASAEINCSSLSVHVYYKSLTAIHGPVSVYMFLLVVEKHYFFMVVDASWYISERKVVYI